MSRRGLLLKIVALCAIIATPILPSVLQAKTWLGIAVRGTNYPGPIRPLDKKAVSRPGKWAG